MYVWCPVACPMCVLGDMSGVCRLQHPNLLCLQKHRGWHVSGLPMILLRKFWGKPIHHKQPQLWDYQMELSATPCHSHSLKYLEESNATTCHNMSQHVTICHNMSQLFIPSSRSGTTERTERTDATPPPGGGRSTAPLSVGPSLRSPTFTTRNISQHKT